MSWLSFLGIGGKQDPLGRSPAQRMYIVDGTGLADNRSRLGNGHPSPRDHYLALRNLAQFAGRERISLVTVFIGRPLREAGEGETYKGVKVHYAENLQEQSAKLLQLVRSNVRSKDVVLISGDAELEREAAALNAACMRLSTLKKAMDEREDRGERDGDHPQRFGRSRPPMDRRQESERQERQPEPERRSEPDRRPEPERQPDLFQRQPEPTQPPPAGDQPRPPPPEKDKPEPGVLDLIDPV